MIFIFYFDERLFCFRRRIGDAPAEPTTMNRSWLIVCIYQNIDQLLRSLISHPEDGKKKKKKTPEEMEIPSSRHEIRTQGS